jgi:anti-sigma-K factor RskA
MDCQGFPAESYGLYALGNPLEEDREAIDEHVAINCLTCMEELSQYRVLWTRIGSVTPLAHPSRNLRTRVIRSVGGRASWWAAPLPALAAACALILAFVGGWVWQKPNTQIAFSPVYQVNIPAPAPPAIVETVIKQVPVPEVRTEVKTEVRTVDNPQQAAAIATLNQDLARERQRVAQLESQLANIKPPVDDGSARRIAELERQVAQYRVLLEAERKRADQTLLLASMVSDPSLRVVKLRATEKNRAIEGHALIAGNSRMVFYASQLPALPANRVYQLWLIRSNGQAIASAGIFTPDSSNRGAVQLRDPALLSGVTTMAVTDEPAGGSAQPTGHKWLVGS